MRAGGDVHEHFVLEEKGDGIFGFLHQRAPNNGRTAVGLCSKHQGCNSGVSTDQQCAKNFVYFELFQPMSPAQHRRECFDLVNPALRAD